jgi:hypothetical protein
LKEEKNGEKCRTEEATAAAGSTRDGGINQRRRLSSPISKPKNLGFFSVSRGWERTIRGDFQRNLSATGDFRLC